MVLNFSGTLIEVEVDTAFENLSEITLLPPLGNCCVGIYSAIDSVLDSVLDSSTLPSALLISTGVVSSVTVTSESNGSATSGTFSGSTPSSPPMVVVSVITCSPLKYTSTQKSFKLDIG